MTIKPRHDFKPCVPGAFSGGLSRTSFFDGMVLTEADMLREQSYWGIKRKLTNRALGQGVVWGLNMTWNEKTRCFELCPGYGLSCCGDDLVVECPETVCEKDLIDPCSEDFRRLLADKTDPCNCDPDPNGPVEACLMLEYVECPEDPRQVFEDPCAENPKGCRFGAIRETTRLRLVPPPCPEPAGPIDRFCEKIAEIKEALEQAGIEMPSTYVGNAAPELRLGVSGIDAAGNPTTGKGSLALDANAMLEAPLGNISDQNVEFTFAPPAGYVFTQASVDEVERAGADILMGFTIERTASQVTAGLNSEIYFEMIPLLSGTETVVAKMNLITRNEDAGIVVIAQVLDVERVPGRKDCTDYFAEGLFLKGDANCTLRTLALAVMTGWFKGLIGAPNCAPADQPAPEPAKIILAWLVTWLAWRVLFGVDLREDQAKGVEACLRKLFAEWCDGMHYKGPRCEHNQHGIYLGCVMISPKGRILCFDEWKHRRYVLTGPLLTHWAGQFGVAPIDVTATRLASWICCIAKTEMPEPPEEFAQQFDSLFNIGNGGIGGLSNAGAVAEYNGAPVESVKPVSVTRFMESALQQFQTMPAHSAVQPQAYSVLTAPGLGLQLAVPALNRAPKLVQQSSIAELAISARIAESPAMARQPMADFVDRLAEKIVVSDLKPPTDSVLVAPMVDALEAADISTLSELVALGPEPALDRVRASLAEDPEFEEEGSAERAMSLVFNASLKTLGAAGDAIAEEAKERSEEEPFLRADLSEIATITALRKSVNATLKGRGLTAAAMRGVAGKAIAAKP